jgi:dipeptidyl aminopeptidase/acylaminoacyl peptidase
VWISNPDGSYLTQIISFPIENHYDLHRLISPQGDRMAVVVNSDGALDLLDISIPGGEPRHITQLITLSDEDLAMNPTSDKAFALYAVRDYDNIAWQPGSGRLLAFMGAMDGPTSDLYLYDTESQVLTQITHGGSQAVFPTWSPDGKYILHFGVSWRPPFGGAIVGHTNLDGIWAVRAADGGILTMPAPKSVTLNFVGWQDEGHYITYDSDPDCYSKNLRSVEVSSGKTTPITDLSFYYGVARSPENGAFLFAGAAGCPSSPGEGVFLLPPGAATPAKLLDKKAYQVEWMPENRAFWAYPEALFSADGSLKYLPPLYDKSFHPAISRKGYQAWEVIENQKGRVEVSTDGRDWRTLLEGHVNAMTWDPLSGETLLIVLEDGTLYSASYPGFAPQAMGTITGGASQVIWLP